MSRYLALDQSLSSTGFAVWDEGDLLPRSGSWALCDGINSRALAFVGLHREIGKLHRERSISLIVYEQPIKVPSDKVEKLIGLYGMAAHIESIAKVHLIPVLVVGVRTWRATFLDDGRKGATPDQLKRMAIERARQFGMDPTTHDEAEAIGILDHILHAQRITPPWRAANPFLKTLA